MIRQMDGARPRQRPILVGDLFCGAGGSSTGARQAIERDLGRRMDLVCVNHWDRAIETHSRMHPEARHYCRDVSSARPIECVPEGRLDLLMASPTCTYHSRARGGRPTSDQQRMDPWHVVTWLTELVVDRVLIENVPEFVDWGPVDARTGRPVPSKRGLYFREWIATLERLGYRVDWKVLNCADYGDATTRRRFFLMGRRRAGRLRWPEPTHTREPGHDLLAPLQRWRAARDCIDWSMGGRSIFNRKSPLAPRTVQRIYAGAARFNWPEPYTVVLRRHMAARSIDLPLPTVVANGGHVGLATPVLIGQHHDRPIRSVQEPAPAITTVARVGLVEPFVLSQGQGGEGRGVSEPLPTIPCGGAHSLITPYYGGGSGKSCKPVDRPLDTITTLDRFGLVVPTTHAGGHNRARDVTDPLPTLTTAKRGELAFITASFGERDGQLPRTHDLELPMPTIPAQGSVRLAQAVAGEGGEGDDLEVDGQRYDILFRMLHWRELARAMSFSDDDQEYEFAGNKTEITRQIGNAVPVRTARALVRAALWDMAIQ
jgi:DNA (cytosine-5)-methyltransferase 1